MESRSNAHGKQPARFSLRKCILIAYLISSLCLVRAASEDKDSYKYIQQKDENWRQLKRSGGGSSSSSGRSSGSSGIQVATLILTARAECLSPTGPGTLGQSTTEQALNAILTTPSALPKAKRDPIFR